MIISRLLIAELSLIPDLFELQSGSEDTQIIQAEIMSWRDEIKPILFRDLPLEDIHIQTKDDFTKLTFKLKGKDDYRAWISDILVKNQCQLLGLNKRWMSRNFSNQRQEMKRVRRISMKIWVKGIYFFIKKKLKRFLVTFRLYLIGLFIGLSDGYSSRSCWLQRMRRRQH